jgi:hypothetical protein
LNSLRESDRRRLRNAKVTPLKQSQSAAAAAAAAAAALPSPRPIITMAEAEACSQFSPFIKGACTFAAASAVLLPCSCFFPILIICHLIKRALD